MKDRRQFFNFDLDFLMELSSDPQSLVSSHHTDYHFALHPWHLTNFNQSVKDTICEKISQYMSKLDGILLGYTNLKLKSHVGKIHADSCFIHFDSEADFFVFKPEVDKCLNGTVIKKSKDHISCKVYNCFTISISKPNDEEMWVGNDVDVGDIVKMNIEYIDYDYEVPSIKAIILNKEQCGNKINRIRTFDDTECNAISSGKKKNSKKKKNFTDITNEDADTEAGDSETTVVISTFNRTKKPKSKQKNRQKQNAHLEIEHLIDSVSPSDGITGCVENEIDSSVFVTTVSQPKIQISSSENESISPRKHVKRKGKKEPLSPILKEEHEMSASSKISKIKTEKDPDLREKKRKLKDTSFDETNNESPEIARPKKKKKRSSMSMEATKDRLLDSILKEKMQEMNTDYTNVQVKHEEIILPDLDMKDILESIGPKKNMTQNSGTSFQSGSFEMSDSSLERLFNSPVKREPGVPQRKSTPVKREPGVPQRKSTPVKRESGVPQRKSKAMKKEMFSPDDCDSNLPKIKKEKA